MLPEDPECPHYLKLMAIAELESQIERIKDSITKRVRADDGE